LSDVCVNCPLDYVTVNNRFRRKIEKSRSTLIAKHNPEARSSHELVPKPDRKTFRRGEKPLARISRCINVYFDLAR